MYKRQLELGGFSKDQHFTGINGGSSVMTGFARNAIPVSYTHLDVYKRQIGDNSGDNLGITLFDTAYFAGGTVYFAWGTAHFAVGNTFLGITLGITWG